MGGNPPNVGRRVAGNAALLPLDRRDEGQARTRNYRQGGPSQDRTAPNLAQPWSGRLRAGCTYCSACNSVYQGLLSDVLRAGWYLFKACYLRGSMPGADALYGCRPVNEIHDQFLVETRLCEAMRLLGLWAL